MTDRELYLVKRAYAKKQAGKYDDPDYYFDWDFNDEDLRGYGISKLRENLFNAKNDATIAKIKAMQNANIAKNMANGGRAFATLAGIIPGAYLGGSLGYNGANYLANKFKLLGKDKSLNRRRLGVALQLLGTAAGAAAGGFGGKWIGNKISDKLFDTTGLTYTSPDDVLKK